MRKRLRRRGFPPVLHARNCVDVGGDGVDSVTLQGATEIFFKKIFGLDEGSVFPIEGKGKRSVGARASRRVFLLANVWM
jgi:hypothetical protein